MSEWVSEWVSYSNRFFAEEILYILVVFLLFLYCVKASLGLSDDQQQMQEMAVRFAQEEMAPHMAKWDQEVWLACSIDQLIDWLIIRLIDWLVDWLIDSLSVKIHIRYLAFRNCSRSIHSVKPLHWDSPPSTCPRRLVGLGCHVWMRAWYSKHLYGIVIHFSFIFHSSSATSWFLFL